MAVGHILCEARRLDHWEVQRLTVLSLPSYFAQLAPEKVLKSLETVEGRMELRETVRDLRKLLKSYEEKI